MVYVGGLAEESTNEREKTHHLDFTQKTANAAKSVARCVEVAFFFSKLLFLVYGQEFDIQ